MKTTILFVSLFVLFVSCKQEKKEIKPIAFLSPEQQSKLRLDVVRYIDDLAKYATDANKFDTIFDKEYQEKANKTDLMFAYKNPENDTLFFAIAKIAPSLKLKKAATVGKLVYDKNQKIVFYEEGFRTWKMEVPELTITTEMLFQKYIRNEDLSQFYTKNSSGKFIIEFPDDNNTYDSKTRSWQFRGEKNLTQ